MDSMTSPKPDEIARVAEGLTKTMCRALCSARQVNLGEPLRVYDRGMIRKALRTRGLGHGDFCYLTPLGLAIRTHLLSTGADHDR